MNRAPAVAGQFYPGNPDTLRSFLEQSTPRCAAPQTVTGAVSPHAGYVYSGAVAGAVFGRIRLPDTVLLLGPNHTGIGTPAAIVSTGCWETPLGKVPVDDALATALRDACPLLVEDPRAHAREHSLEVQLPFLQFRNPRVRIVPVAFMLHSFTEIEQVGLSIAETLATWPEPVLLVASSDMTHYEPATTAEDKDRKAIARIEALDAWGLWETVRRLDISMCGVIPTAVMLVAASRMGAVRGELVRYTTSGDTSGDYQRVVGYAGVVVL